MKGTKPRAIQAIDAGLAPSGTAADALRTIGSAALCHLIANRCGVRAGVTEALHETRIALRKLRTAIAFFSSVTPGDNGRMISAELKWIFDRLSHARELDVFIQDVATPLKGSHPLDKNVGALYRSCIQRQKKEYKEIKLMLASRRFRRFLLAVAKWLEVLGEARTDGVSAKRIAAAKFSALKKKMKLKKSLKKMGCRRLHKLRRRAKDMRDATEFTEGLFGGKRRNRALVVLRRMQSSLGAINDIYDRRKVFEEIIGSLKDRDKMKAEDKKTRSRLTKLLFRNKRERISKLLKISAAAHEKFFQARNFWR